VTISSEATRGRTAVSGDPDARPPAGLLHQRLAGSSAPVLLDDERTLTASSLWVAVRVLVAGLRAAGLRRGDRVLVVPGADLVTAIAVNAEPAVAEAAHWLRETPSPWAALGRAVHGLPSDRWPRTAKGALDRYGDPFDAPMGAAPTPFFSMGRDR